MRWSISDLGSKILDNFWSKSILGDPSYTSPSVLPPQPTLSTAMPTTSPTGTTSPTEKKTIYYVCQDKSSKVSQFIKICFRTAIVDTWRSYTYGELHSYAAAIASSLQGRRGARWIGLMVVFGWWFSILVGCPSASLPSSLQGRRGARWIGFPFDGCLCLMVALSLVVCFW